MTNFAIYCNCYITEYQRYKILGSITPEGVIEILRGHRNKTTIQSKEFIISCSACGFLRHILLNETVLPTQNVALKRTSYAAD